MRCPGKRAIDAYTRGELSPRESAQLLEHADGCADCQARLTQATERIATPPSLRETGPRAKLRHVQFYDPQESDETMPGQPPMMPVEPRGRASTRARTHRVRPAGLLDGRYELLGLLSQGGMADVFKARHRELGREVAVKLVLEGLKDDSRMRELFFSEARITSALSHPNVAQVTDFGVDESMGFFLVMDLLDGETLRQRMRRQALSVRVAAHIIDQVVGAARYIHERGIVHCDLKPENIFLVRLPTDSSSNHVKLIDFGLSFRNESLLDSQIGGTPPYLAPERLEGAPPSPLCDVYSIGVVLYELLAGRLPFLGTQRDVMAQQLRGVMPPPPSQSCKERLEERADAMVLRALARDPAARHASAEALHFELRTWMEMRGLRAPRVPHPSAAAVPSLATELEDSPIPLAVFDQRGQTRFINAAFLARLEGTDGAEVASFEHLQITRRDRSLRDAFLAAVTRGEPVRRAVRGTANQRGLLVLVPVVRQDRIDGVHVTWLDHAPAADD